MGLYGEFVPPSPGLGNLLVAGAIGAGSAWDNALIKDDKGDAILTDVFNFTHTTQGHGAVGGITSVGSAVLVDHDFFTITDPVHGAYVFEFDANTAPPFVPVAGRYTIVAPAAGALTATQVSALMIAAINATDILITAVPTGANVALTADNGGLAYNIAVTENVGAAGFAVSGMAGGTNIAAIGMGASIGFSGENDADPGVGRGFGRVGFVATRITDTIITDFVVLARSGVGILTQEVFRVTGLGAGLFTYPLAGGLVVTPTAGITATNPVAATNGVPLQYGPIVASSGTVWDLAAGGSCVAIQGGMFVYGVSIAGAYPILEFRTKTGAGAWTAVGYFVANGQFRCVGDLVTGSGTVYGSTFYNAVAAGQVALLSLTASAGAMAACRIWASAGPKTAGNILEVGDGANPTFVRKFAVNWEGRLFQMVPNSAPVDADIPTGGFSAYLNEAGNLLLFRVRYSDGVTFKTGTVALV